MEQHRFQIEFGFLQRDAAGIKIGNVDEIRQYVRQGPRIGLQSLGERRYFVRKRRGVGGLADEVCDEADRREGST